jgi:xanthine dehydrogenase accessory factor
MRILEMDSRKCYQLVAERLLAGVDVVVATVVGTKGSTPREPGAKMVIQADRSWGTIGGGCAEADVLEVAGEMLKADEEASRIVHVDLTEDILESSDRICGGTMEILLESWREESAELKTLADVGFQTMVRAISLDGGPEGSYPGERRLAGPLEEQCQQVIETRESRRVSLRIEGISREYFFELVTSGSQLVICGAGHIAQPLAQIGALLGYQVVVIDDRPAFASADRFCGAHQVLARPFVEALDSLEITPDMAAVLVTRGHRHDELCLRYLLGTSAGYIGMLGSRRRVRAVYDSLLADGFARDQLDRVWSPIGIDIGAQSPAEIALSIMAELVALRRGRLGGHLSTSHAQETRSLRSRDVPHEGMS